MLHYDNGLFLTRAQMGVDVRRRLPRCFVSHAHADHIARHQLAVATSATAHLLRHRLGPRNRVAVLDYGESVDFAGVRLTSLPAGHCLGSAMLLADDGEQRLLYTGDFKLGPSATAEPANLPQADILVMESTFGRPRYRLPPRDDVIGQLHETVERALEDGLVPVVHAYELGKAQEVTKLLTSAGTPVLQHPSIYAISRLYQRLGVDLGDVGEYAGHPVSGHAIVTLPREMKQFRLRGLSRGTLTIATTGWAVDPGCKYRWGVDVALPLSDHADYDDLVDTVRRVAPREVYCTHGPLEFVDHLRDLGFNAQPLAPSRQRTLF
jgi:Cft2 family RNA processing exonuclease